MNKYKEEALAEDGEIEGIPGSTSALITFGVNLVFEALKTDIRTYPGGLESFAKNFGLAPQTVRAWWNPHHARCLNLSSFVELMAVSPATNTRNALNTVADAMTRHRQEVTERRSRELKAKLQRLSEGV